MGKIVVSKYGHLMLPGAFSDKVTSAVDFTDEVVGQCHVPVVNLHMTHKC